MIPAATDFRLEQPALSATAPVPLFAIGARIVSDINFDRTGVVTARRYLQDGTMVGNVWAWYYRVRWGRERKDQGLYHETMIVSANIRPVPLSTLNSQPSTLPHE